MILLELGFWFKRKRKLIGFLETLSVINTQPTLLKSEKSLTLFSLRIITDKSDSNGKNCQPQLGFKEFANLLHDF